MRTVALDFPKSILIETTNLCQGSCKFCPYKAIRFGDDPVFLDFDRYKKMINEIANYNVVRLTLFNNNEPLLDYRIADFVEYAHKVLPNVEITLSTNGRLLTLNRIKELNDAGLTTLYVSIPTIDRDNYKRIMGIEPDRIINLLKNIDNEDYLKMIRIAVPITKYYDRELMESVFNKYRICEWGLEYKESWNIDEYFNTISCGLKYEGPCDRPMDQMVVNSDGNVIICCRDWNYQNVIGNVYNNSLYEIWHGNKMKEIQSYIATEDYDNIECCKDCTMNKDYCLRKVKTL